MAEGPQMQVLGGGGLAPRHCISREEFGSMLQNSTHQVYKVDYSLSACLS